MMIKHIYKCHLLTLLATPLSLRKMIERVAELNTHLLLWRFWTLKHKININYQFKDASLNEWKCIKINLSISVLNNGLGWCWIIDLWSLWCTGLCLSFILYPKSVVMVTVFNLLSVKLQTCCRKLNCYICHSLKECQCDFCFS